MNQHSSGVVHATLDPGGPGVARLHLVPPKPGSPSETPWILFINGWHILPVGGSWARLLKTFIEVLTEEAEQGEEISEEQLGDVVNTVVSEMTILYPHVREKKLRRDLDELVTIVMGVARGEIGEEIQSSMTLQEYAHHMTSPHRMDLIISPMKCNGEWRCQLHCPNCYAMGQEGMQIDRELTTDEWKRVINRCREAGIPQLTFTGGEPTMREDLVELVAHAEWHITRLNTNGVVMTPELARELYEASLDGVQITLYSHDKDVHDKLVGEKGAWHLTIQGIHNAIDAGLNVSVNTPLVRANSAYPITMAFLNELGVRYCACSGLIPTGGAPSTVRRGEALENSEMYQILKGAVQITNSLGMELSFTSPGWLTPEQLDSLDLASPMCGACLSNMAVMPNGAVAPCQSWLNDPDGLGNILTDPWESIWEHPGCIEIRNQSMSGHDCPLKGVV